MVIIGGLGSILGSFLGAAFIVLVPIFLTNMPHWLGIEMSVALQKQIELMVFGGLIIFFLIVEPHGWRGSGRSARRSCACGRSRTENVLTPPPETGLRWKWRRGSGALGRRAVAGGAFHAG